MAPENVYIIDAVRTPVGKRGGGLSDVHPADLGAAVLEAAVDRTGVPPSVVDDVIFGCVNAIGAQAGNIARTAWLSAGFPEHVPGITIDRRCGSSQQAVTFAAQSIAAGDNNVVVAGGVEVMSLVPLGSPESAGAQSGYGERYAGDRWIKRYGKRGTSQFNAADLIADRWGLERSAMQEFALESHRRALRARSSGRFDAEIVPVQGLKQDEGPRADTTIERMSALPPLRKGGTITAALASQISDGAACLVLASERAIEQYSLTPLARVRGNAAVGSDLELMLTGPIPATQAVLHRVQLEMDDIELIEMNEAFASVVLAWASDTGASLDITNVNGGAIALGHPLGATGARLMTTLVHELSRREARYGLQVMCEGGGTANATVLERV